MRALAVLVICASTTAIAQPDQSSQAKAAAREGEQRYQAGDYVRAAEHFAEAYRLEADPAYLFNLAQSYRLANACAKAATAYRKLLGVVSSGPNTAKIERYIQQMDACATSQAATPPPSAPPPAPPVGSPVTSPPPPPPPERTSNPALRYTGIGLVAVGAASLALGIYATKRVSDVESEREGLCASGCTWADVRDRAAALDEDGARYQRWMQVGYVAGGVAVAGGVVLMWLGRDREVETTQVTVVPTIGGAMAVGTVAF